MPTLNLKKTAELTEWPNDKFYIMDLEYTSWKNSWKNAWQDENEYIEIVQIGILEIIRFNGSFKTTNEFSALVIPKINNKLSKYFINLTNIQQFDIDKYGVSFENAVNEISLFLNDNFPILCNGDDGEVMRENFIINKLIETKWLQNIYDFRTLLSNSTKINKNYLVSSQMPYLFNIKRDIKAHNALDDCYSIYETFKVLKKEKVIFN